MTDNVVFVSRKKKIMGKVSGYVLLILIIILFGTTRYFYLKYKNMSQSVTLSRTVAQKKAEKIVEDVSKLMILPKNETPAVATINNIDILKDQLFFKNAANGNNVLIYSNSGLAVVYDAKNNLIISVGPINYSQFSNPTPTILKTRIALRNGTSVAGITYRLEVELKNIIPNIEITQREQNKRVDYEKTVVVVLDDTSKGIAEELAKKMSLQIVDLPEGEDKPSAADILIIAGKDKV